MKKIALFIVVVATASACMKSAEQPPSQRESQLYSRQWKLESITQKSENDPYVDSSIIKNCHSDDIIRLSADGQFQLLDNTNTCDSAILKYDTGLWLISVDQQRLLLVGQKTEKLWNIVTLNDSVLKVTWQDSISVNQKILKTISMINR